MLKNIFYFVIIISLFSCNKIKKTYFSNGTIKEELFVSEGKKIDSALFYYNNPMNSIKKKIIYLPNDTTIVKEFYKNNNLKAKGKLLPNGHKYKYWKYFDDKGTLVNYLEYLNIDGKEYLNRSIAYGVNGDTLSGKSNFYVLKTKNKTFKINESIKFYFYLQEPFFSYNSEVLLYLPKNSLSDLDSKFSKLNDVALDTIVSLKNDGIKHNELPQNAPLNRMFVFNLKFLKPGVKKIRGFIEEKKGKGKSRILFFDKKIVVVSGNDTE